MLHTAFSSKLRYIILILFFTFQGLSTAIASNYKEVKDLYTPKTIILKHSKENLKVRLRDGSMVIMPQIVKIIVPQNWEVDPYILKNTASTPLPTVNEMREMQQLSNKLGIEVTENKHLALYREAVKWLGTRYKWAGNSSKGVDCSGLTGILVKSVFNKDISRISHVIADQLNEELNAEDLTPGDLVFFSTRRAKRINHVGVYLGDRQFIHASRKGVVVSSLDDKYYSQTFKKAGRI